MKKSLHYFLLLFFICSCHSNDGDQCSGKQVTCPAFDDNIVKQWIPYENRSILIFTSSSGKDTFYIEAVSKSDPYQTTISARSPSCNSNKQWNSYGDPLNIYVGRAVDQYNSSSIENINISIKEQSFTGYGFTDTGINVRNSYDGSVSEKTNFFTTITLNNSVFNNVQSLEKDTTSMIKPDGIYKIYLAKNKGIVAYEELPYKTLWVKK